MSADSSLPLQAAIVARLKANTALNAVVHGRVYDRAPDDAETPYVQIGEAEVTPFRAQCMRGVSQFLSITTWADGHLASVDVKRMNDAIVASLDEQSFPVAGHIIQTLSWVRTRGPFRDPDGVTRQGVNEFTCITLPAG